jgi:hypothetical protein
VRQSSSITVIVCISIQPQLYALPHHRNIATLQHLCRFATRWRYIREGYECYACKHWAMELLPSQPACQPHVMHAMRQRVARLAYRPRASNCYWVRTASSLQGVAGLAEKICENFSISRAEALP